MKIFVLSCCSLLFPFLLSAQFFVNGDAISYGDTCFLLTTDQNWQAGSIWHPDKIDLNQSFNLVAQVNLGCKDVHGADGIVFGLQPVSTSIGQGGGAIGFGGVVPSLGVEIDTYWNPDFGDITSDHITIIRDGNLDHNTPSGSLAGPIKARFDHENIEDCKTYDFVVNWDAPNHQLDVYFDCVLRLTYVGNIVQEIFNGDPLVFWGFTSATGGENNVQQVCINYSTFLDELEDKVMCPGGQVLLDLTPGLNYQWTPVEGLSDPTIHNPIASPEVNTIYLVEITDDCGIPFFDEVTITIAGDSTLIDIGQDTVLCEGDQLLLDATTPFAVYEWSTNETTPTVFVSEEGEYSVTVTRTDIICVTEDKITIENILRPSGDLGADTTLCLDQTIWLNAIFPETTYLWQDGSTVDSFFVNKEGLYQLTLSHFCGDITDQINVFYEDCQEVYLPNVFSPNFDGINDAFFPMDGGDVVQINNFQIFDRWGSLVFERKDFLPNISSLGWGGKWRGKTATQGLYIWFLDVNFKDGSRVEKSGGVNLIY